MLLLAVAAALAIAALGFAFLVRPGDLPQEAPPPPWKHLDSRKAAIYENLRDLQFEYRVGKLSDDDYTRTKAELQTELATVLAGIDALKQSAPPAAKSPKKKEAALTCPHCSAQFDKVLKFCGECGKPMGASA